MIIKTTVNNEWNNRYAHSGPASQSGWKRRAGISRAQKIVAVCRSSITYCCSLSLCVCVNGAPAWKGQEMEGSICMILVAARTPCQLSSASRPFVTWSPQWWWPFNNISYYKQLTPRVTFSCAWMYGAGILIQFAKIASCLIALLLLLLCSGNIENKIIIILLLWLDLAVSFLQFFLFFPLYT